MKQIIFFLLAVMAVLSSNAEVKEIHDFWEDIPATGRPIIIEAYASWCAPCRVYGPIFERVAEKFEGQADFYRVNIEDPESAPFVEEYEPRAIPSTYFHWDPFGDYTYKQKTEEGLISEAELEAMVRATIMKHTTPPTE